MHQLSAVAPLSRNVAMAAAVVFLLLVAASIVEAAPVTVGPGGFNDGWATQITYDPNASRGSSNNRNNPLNALGPANDTFFEIGSGASADFTFGRDFNTDVTVYEVTFGNVSRWEESADLYVGFGGVFHFVSSISNADAQNGLLLGLLGLPISVFDTVRLTDTSSLPGIFDVDAVQVSPVPLPAAAWLFLSALGAMFGIKRVAKRQPLIA